MPREATSWKCDNCGTQQTGGVKPPEGWVETSFWNSQRFIRNVFCSYSCLSNWSSRRYDLQPKHLREEVVQER